MPTPRATRAAAERAAAELTARQADRLAEPPVTAKVWLAAHAAEARSEDPHRPITEDQDLAEAVDQRARDQRDAGPGEPPPGSAERSPQDIRETAAGTTDSGSTSARDRDGDAVRVPTADETAESVRRAQRALQELKHRQAADGRHAEDEASRRHTEQQERENQYDMRTGRAARDSGVEPLALDA